MAVFTIARFEIRPEARDQAERAMHAYASYVRSELPGSMWTAYRDPHAPAHYACALADGPYARSIVTKPAGSWAASWLPQEAGSE